MIIESKLFYNNTFWRYFMDIYTWVVRFFIILFSPKKESAHEFLKRILNIKVLLKPMEFLRHY